MKIKTCEKEKMISKIKVNLDKHDLLQVRNSILLRLETAKDLLNIDGDIEKAIRYINEGEEKLNNFFEENIEYD